MFGFYYVSTGPSALSVLDAERLSFYREKWFPTETTRLNSIVDSGPILVCPEATGQSCFFIGIGHSDNMSIQYVLVCSVLPYHSCLLFHTLMVYC